MMLNEGVITIQGGIFTLPSSQHFYSRNFLQGVGTCGKTQQVSTAQTSVYIKLQVIISPRRKSLPSS